MNRHRMPGQVFRLLILLAAFAIVAAACDSSSSDDTTATTAGASQGGGDDLSGALADAQAQVDSLTAQLASAGAKTVVQAGALTAAPAPVPLASDGWATEESVRGGLWLVAEFDSAGDDAWDIAAHPRVYYTSESWDTLNPAITDETNNFIGYHVVDADTHDVIFSWTIGNDDGNGLMGAPITRGPHGVGVSPDGAWVYVGWSETPAEERLSYVGVINARTGMIDKILHQNSAFEGGTRSQALHHIQCFVDFEGNDRCVLQWGFGANGGPHFVIDPNDGSKVVQAINYDDIKPMGHPFTTPSPDGQFIYVSMSSNWIRGNHSPAAAVAKYDLATGEHTVIEGTGHHPIGITHTADGAFTYVIDGHGGHVYKIDNELNEVIEDTNAGIAGPYGICLNWNEQEIWVVGKGEGTHNQGNSLSMVDGVGRFRASRAFNQPLYLGGSASSVDHCALNPDPDTNEIWVSNMKGWETIVVSLDTKEVTDYIATPNGGDTHGMAFVWYDAGWDDGVLMVDMGGPKSDAMWAEVAARVAADAPEESG